MVAAQDFADDEINLALSSADKVRLYREMLRCRVFEQVALQQYIGGKIGGWLNLQIGQEAIAVAVRSLMEPHDHSICGMRGIGHALAAGMTMRAGMAELYGRATDKLWGMYFPGDPSGLLRHPSELYEAGLEGLSLFLILWSLRNNEKYKNHLLVLYIIGYATLRIVAEFFREPDAQIGYLFLGLTLGQILSLGMLIFGLSIFFVGRKRKNML